MVLPNEAKSLLDEAETCYKKALDFNPMNSSAVSGLKRVRGLRSELLDYKIDEEQSPKTPSETHMEDTANLYILVKSGSGLERGAQSNRIMRLVEKASFPDKNDSTIDTILKTYSGFDSITIDNMLTLMDNLGYHKGGAVIAGIYDGRKPTVRAGYNLHEVPKTEVKQYLTKTTKLDTEENV